MGNTSSSVEIGVAGFSTTPANRPVRRASPVLGVVRSDPRALSSYLSRHVGARLADGFQKDLFRVPASEIVARYADLVADAHRLTAIKGALVGISANLRLEMRRTFEHDLPTVDAGATYSPLARQSRDFR